MSMWWSGRIPGTAREAADGPGRMATGPAGRDAGMVPIDLEGTVHIAHCSADNRVEAIIAGRVTADPPDGGPPPCGATPRVAGTIAAPPGRGHAALLLSETGYSQLALGVADPFVWLQLVDDRGAPVTEEACLGHGANLQCRIHARAPLGVRCAVTLVPPFGAHATARTPRLVVREVTVRGLYARLLLRTYGCEVGPRFQTEVLMIPLLEPGHRLRFRVALETWRGSTNVPTRLAMGDRPAID